MTEENIGLEHFPNFLRAIYPETKEWKNDECIEIGKGFYRWLKLHHPNIIVRYWHLEPEVVIPNMDLPSRIHGYHPALVMAILTFMFQSLFYWKSVN